MLQLPARGRKLRWVIILYGLLIFLWLGPEDTHVWPVALLGSGASLLVIIWWLLGHYSGHRIPTRWLPLLTMLTGAAAGFGGSVITAVLMLLKNARHAHVFPEYPAPLMLAVLERAPAWMLAGALLGLGVSALWIALQPPTTE
jgi:hypothetical protein